LSRRQNNITVIIIFKARSYILRLSPSAVTRRRWLGWSRFSGLSILILYHIISISPTAGHDKFYRPHIWVTHHGGGSTSNWARTYVVVVIIVVEDLYRLRTGERIFFNNTSSTCSGFFYVQYELHAAHHDVSVSCSVRANRLKIVPRANRKKNHILYYIYYYNAVISRLGVWWPKRKYVVLPGNILLLLLLRGFATLWRTRSVL